METPHIETVTETKAPQRNFEREIRDLIIFKDIDPSLETAGYHEDMVKGLLERTGQKPSLMRAVLKEQCAAGTPLEKIIVESVIAEDISRGIGTQRNVDRFSFYFKDKEPFYMTVSLDIEPSRNIKNSASYNESKVLKRASSNADQTRATQRYFGFTQVRDKRGVRGLICKEYLPGVMLANFTADLHGATQRFGKEAMTEIARATGYAFGQTYYEVGGVPVDAHHMNVIIHEDETGVTARFCDVEHARADVQGVLAEKQRMLRAFGPYADAFLDGVREASRAEAPLPPFFI